MTQAAYCREHQLCAKSFTSWKRKLTIGTATEFIPIQLNTNSLQPLAAENSTGITIRVTLPNGIAQEFGTPDGALPTLLASLVRMSC